VATPARDRDLEQAVTRGSELLRQGNIEGAQKVFRAALALDEGNPRLLALLGLSHFKGGQFAQARPIYEQLVERAPTDASHRLNLGLVFLKLGDAERAIEALEASRALDPSQGRAVSYLGLAYARAGRYSEAYRAFLLAGQKELASEIELNLTDAERDAIHTQLQRSGLEPAVSRTQTPPDRPSLQRDKRPTKPSEPPPPAPPASPPASGVRLPASAPEPPPASGVRLPASAPEPPPASGVRLPASAPEPEKKKPEPPPPEAPPAVVTPPPETAVPSLEITAPRMTDSLQFVLPAAAPVPKAADGRSMISQAVEAASAASAGATRAAASGNAPPMPLSQLATEALVRADDGEHAFEVAVNGALVVRVTDRVLTRLDGVHVTGGDLAYEPAMRRSRGHQTDDAFDYGGAPLHVVTGAGYVIALPGDRVFTAVTLDDDIFYLREDLVFAFEASLRWENGNIPGLRGRLPVVQFRGDGSVALRTAKPLVRVKLPAQGVLFVDATRLAGWIGRVIPRAVVPPSGGPMGDMCVECTGEGIVLVDPIGDPGGLAPPRVIERAGPTKPPPAPSSDTISAKDLLGDDEF
jgi:hypothetical protein